MCSNPITKHFGAGGVEKHDSLQLLLACWALERDFALETRKKLWKQINVNAHGVHQFQPVLAHWKHVVEILQKVFKQKRRFQKDGRVCVEQKISTFKKKKIYIETDLHDMIIVEELIATCKFMDGLFMAF